MSDRHRLTSRDFLAAMRRMGPIAASELDSLPRDIRGCIEAEWMRAWLEDRTPHDVASATSRDELLRIARARACERSRMLDHARSLLARDGQEPPPPARPPAEGQPDPSPGGDP